MKGGRAPRLYLITDRRATNGRPLLDVVAAALGGIAGLAPAEVAVQLREKDLEGRALTELARAFRAVTAAAGVGLYVNDRLDVALAVGADGVHLGHASLAPAVAAGIAARLQPPLAIAVSAHAVADLAALDRPTRDQIAFAVFGPINDTPSKRAFGPPVGLPALRAAAGLGVPLVAIGGLSPADVAPARAAGAAGVACIRAILGAADPAATVGTFCQQLK
jgi:thiamine-phosphate pyrophosphorylase